MADIQVQRVGTILAVAAFAVAIASVTSIATSAITASGITIFARRSGRCRWLNNRLWLRCRLRAEQAGESLPQ